MAPTVKKYALLFGMTSEIRHSGASAPTGLPRNPRSDRPGPRTTGLTMYGCPSITSSKTGIFPRFCP
jgi:hypothetical protein